MKRILLFAVLIGSAMLASAQTPANECKRSLANAPSIRGIHLGMNTDQALALFPGSAADKTLQAELSEGKFGFQRIDLSPRLYGSKEQFTGVSSVYLRFLDGALTFFALEYNGPEWQSDEQFASRIAETLSLPQAKSWKAAQGGLALTCDGFQIVATRIGTPRIAVKNLQADIDKVLHDRMEEPKEKARRAFKP